MKLRILSLTLLLLIQASAAHGGAILEPEVKTCPQTPAEWETERSATIFSLMDSKGESSFSFAVDLKTRLQSCKIEDPVPGQPSSAAQKCMANLSVMLTEFTRDYAEDYDLKFTSVPTYLQDPKIIELVNAKKMAEALSYIKNVVAKRPGVPSLTVEAFAGAVSSPQGKSGGHGNDRLVVKFVDTSGNTKWINFASPHPDEVAAPDNISVVSHSKEGHSYFQDFVRTVDGGKVSLQARSTGAKDCRMCHVQGANSISFANRLQWSGVKDTNDRVDTFNALNAERKGAIRPMGIDGRPIEVSKFGPGMGLGIDESERTNVFMESCFDDVLKSKDPEDQKHRQEIERLMKNPDKFESGKNRVRSYMNCGECHNRSNQGTLPYPVGFATRLDGKSVHLNRIYDGSMPENDYTGELTAADRRVLASCLFKEQYGFPVDQKPNLESVKNGRFYKSMAEIDCSTGRAKESLNTPVTSPGTSKRPAIR